jgi:hypothetical protein
MKKYPLGSRCSSSESYFLSLYRSLHSLSSSLETHIPLDPDMLAMLSVEESVLSRLTMQML